MITFRPHVSEPEELNKFLTIFFASSLFNKSQEYSYNIEKDNTLDAHFHIFLTPEDVALYRDKDKVKQQLTTKEFKPYVKGLSDMKTDIKVALNIVLVGKEKSRNDYMYYLGYVNKEKPHSRENLPISYKNIEPDYIIRSVKYQTELQLLKATKPKRDIKILSSKDVHATILDYCEKNGTEPMDDLLFRRMAADGLFTAFISENQKDEIRSEIDIYLSDKEFQDFYDQEQKNKERDIKRSKELHQSKENLKTEQEHVRNLQCHIEHLEKKIEMMLGE